MLGASVWILQKLKKKIRRKNPEEEAKGETETHTLIINKSSQREREREKERKRRVSNVSLLFAFPSSYSCERAIGRSVGREPQKSS